MFQLFENVFGFHVELVLMSYSNLHMGQFFGTLVHFSHDTYSASPFNLGNWLYFNPS